MARGLNPRQIEAFRAVMQTGTVTAAADVLHTTQPSVSRLLAQLAYETRLKLFDHHHGRLRPTPEAQALLAVVERHFEGMDAIALQVAAIRRAGAGMLRIGCTPALALSVLPQVVHDFIAQRPDVHLKLDTAGMSTLQAGLVRGTHELVLTTQPVRRAGLDAEILQRRNMVAVMHPGVLEAAAIGVPDANSGEAVKLFVVKKDPALTEAQLRDFLHEQLTGYKRPRYIEFRGDLPKTPVGKILRRELRQD